MPVGQKSNVASEKIAQIPEAMKNPKKEAPAKPIGNTKYKVETYEMINDMLDK